MPVEKHVALTVWFLDTGAEYRTIGHLFGVSTVYSSHRHKGGVCCDH